MAAMLAPGRGGPPRLLHVFDAGGNQVLTHRWGAVDALSFPVATLLASIHAYADDGGWGLERVELEHCAMTYRRFVR